MDVGCLELGNPEMTIILGVAMTVPARALQRPRWARWFLACLSGPMVVASGQPASAQIALERMLAPIRQQHGLPALAAAVVVKGELVAVGAVGTR